VQQRITIEANESGRLWADDPEAWENLSRVEGCPFCRNGPPEHEILAETETCWVTAQAQATLPGYVCVISKRHAVEPFHLAPAEQVDFWLDAMATAEGLADVTHPVKMNYEIHGNTIPHLHMHLFPRTPGDVYVGFGIHNRARFTRTEQELSILGDGIKRLLRRPGR
jgi:diadenosine tetraphosphate (Ap4A) HIT family hydrolase